MKLRFLLIVASIALNILLVCSLIWGDNGLVTYKARNNEYQLLKKRLEQLEFENTELSREIVLLQSDKGYIEQMIRKHLNFVRKNEIRYIFDGEAEAGEVAHEPKN